MKESDGNHFVQRFTFDVELERQSDAKPVQDRLSAMFNNRIQGMLEKLLDELDDPNFVVKIDTIEVDLGVISEGAFESQLYYKIKEALERKIRKRVRRILDSGTTDPKEGIKVPLAPAKMELLTFFLEQGRMPVGGEVFQQSIQEIFKELLDINPQEVKKMLNRILPPKPEVARRIVRQFGRETLEKLIKLVAPSHVFYIQSQEQEIISRAREVVSYGRNTIQEEARIALLRFLFENPDQRFSIPSYETEMQKMLAKRLGSPVANILQNTDSVAGKKREEERKIAKETNETLRHRAFIMRALRNGVSSVARVDLIAAWEYLVRKEPETLRTAIGSAANTPSDLLRLLEQLPVPAIRLMIQNVLTQASGTALEVVVAVIAAHAELNLGNIADERFVRAAYAALIQELAVEGRIGLDQGSIAEAVRKNLHKIPEAPAELLDRWHELEIPGVRTPEQRKKDEQNDAIEAARKKAKAEEEKREEIRQKELLEEGLIKEAIRREAADEAEEAEIAALLEKEAAEGTLEERIRKAKEKLAAQKRASRGSTDEPDEATADLDQAEEEQERLRKAKEEKEAEEEIAALHKKETEKEEEERIKREEKEAEEEKQRAAQGETEEDEIKRKRREAEEEAGKEAEKAGEAEETEEETQRKIKEAAAEEEEKRKREAGEDPDWPLPVSRKEAEEEIAEARRNQQDDGVVDARSIDHRPARLPESLFGDEASEEKRRIGIGDPQDITQSFDLATESARIEYIMYYFRYGTDPWWVQNLRQRDIQALVVRLSKSEPQNLVEATRQLIFNTPPSEYPKVAERIIGTLDEVPRLKYMEKVVPDLVGFFATTTRALLLYFEAKGTEISPPSIMSTPQTFAWQLPLQYVLRYYSSRPTASEMLRYVLKETVAVLGIDLPDFVRDLDEIAEKAVEKGERRFAPFRTLLPDPEQEFDISLPQLHPGAPEEAEPETEEVRRERLQKEEEQRLARRESPQDESKALPPISDQPEDAALPVSEKEGTEQPDEFRTEDPDTTEEPDSQQGPKDAPEDTGDSLPGDLPGEDNSSPESEEDEQLLRSDPKQEEEKELSPEQKELKKKREEEKAAEEKQEEEQEPAEKWKILPGETPAEAEIRLAEEREAIARKAKEDWPGGEEPEAEPLLVSVAELLESETESIRVIEYYLRYGALPHQESEKLSRDVFRKLVLEVMVRHERAYVRMVRNISDNLKVRLRLVSLGEQVAVQSILHLNWMAGNPMQPFLNSILKLIKSSGSPVDADPVMEHAVFYVTSNSGASFKAVDYIKALFRYLERYYKVPQFELVQFLIRKNEENAVPVKAILSEILEMVRLAEERRQVKKKPAKPDEPRYGAAGIPEDVEIFVENAGVVLVWPFLYQYFQRLGLMTEERLFKDEESMEKGAHMLQYMVTLEQNAPEEKLFLNKLIVGLPLDYPMHLEVEITDEEKQMTDSLLRSIADQWSMMKGAPPEQLRATFLVRDGIIKKDKENWLLQVEKKGFDLVLKRLPWGLAQIRVPWLEYMINVEWG